MANESLVLTAEVRDSFSSTLRKLQNDLKSLSSTGATSTKTLQRDWRGVGSEIQGAAGSITRDMIPAMRQGNLAGLALGGAIGTAALALKNFAENTSSLAHFSKEIGISTKELSKLQALGSFFGLDPATVQGNLRTFQDFMNRLKNDTGRAIAELRTTFGVAGDELARKLLNANSMKEAAEIAFEAIKSTGNESKARAIAQAVFGNESWARIIRNATPEVLAEIAKVQSKIDENKESADKFNLSMLKFTTTLTNLYQQAMTPLLDVTSNLMDKFGDKSIEGFSRSIESVDKFAKSLAESFKEVVGWINKIEEFTSSSVIGTIAGMLPKPGGGGATPGSGGSTVTTPADRNRKIDSWNSWIGRQVEGGAAAAAAPGSPAKTLEKSNEDLKRSTDELKRSTDKQTTLWERIITAAGQGGDTAGLGPGLGGVSAGGGGLGSLGGAGVLAPFRAAMGGGGGGRGGSGGPSIRHGTGGGANIADPGGRGHVGSWWTPERRQTAIDYLKKNAGLSDIGAQGLVARWAGVEAAQGPSAVNPSSGAIGIAQWLGSRKAGTPADFEGQLAKAAKELNTTEGRAAGMLRGAKTPLEAAVGAAAFERAEGYNPSTGADAHVGKTLATMRAMGRGGAGAPGSATPGAAPSASDSRKSSMEGVHPDLARVIARAQEISGEKFSVFETVRSEARQAEMVRRGWSKTMQSKHLAGRAVDVRAEGDPDEGNLDRAKYERINAAMQQAAKEAGVPVEWGGNWRRFKDIPHFQLPDRYKESRLLDLQQRADAAKGAKLEANGTVNVHLHDGMRDKNAKVDTDGMFKDVKVNRGRPMATAEDMGPLNRASAGF